MDNLNKADLLHGAKAIASFLGLAERQVYYLIETDKDFPVFKIGFRTCARRTSLKVWLDKKERGGNSDE